LSCILVYSLSKRRPTRLLRCMKMHTDAQIRGIFVRNTCMYAYRKGRVHEGDQRSVRAEGPQALGKHLGADEVFRSCHQRHVCFPARPRLLPCALCAANIPCKISNATGRGFTLFSAMRSRAALWCRRWCGGCRCRCRRQGLLLERFFCRCRSGGARGAARWPAIFVCRKHVLIVRPKMHSAPESPALISTPQSARASVCT